MADTQFLLEQLTAHATASEQHPLSTDVAALAARIGLANALYDAVDKENRREGKLTDKDRGALRDGFMRNMYALWDKWYRPIPTLLQRLKELPDLSSIAGADVLLKRAEGVSRYLSAPVEQLIEAMHDCDEGRGIPLEVLRNELRNRARAQVPG